MIIQAVIDAGLIPLLISYAKQHEYPQLQFEATSALTNLTAGTSNQCLRVIEQGGISLFLQLLKFPNPSIVE